MACDCIHVEWTTSADFGDPIVRYHTVGANEDCTQYYLGDAEGLGLDVSLQLDLLDNVWRIYFNGEIAADMSGEIPGDNSSPTINGQYDVIMGEDYFFTVTIVECPTTTTESPTTTLLPTTTTTPAPSATTTEPPFTTSTTTNTTTTNTTTTNTTQPPSTTTCPCSCVCVWPDPSTTPSEPPQIPILTTRTVAPTFLVTSTPPPSDPLTDLIITTPPPTTIETTTTITTSTTFTTVIINCESPCNNLGF